MLSIAELGFEFILNPWIFGTFITGKSPYIFFGFFIKFVYVHAAQLWKTYNMRAENHLNEKKQKTNSKNNDTPMEEQKWGM